MQTFLSYWQEQDGTSKSRECLTRRGVAEGAAIAWAASGAADKVGVVTSKCEQKWQMWQQKRQGKKMEGMQQFNIKTLLL